MPVQFIANGKEELGERIRTSRLIGSDENLVLHGGGNTSVKLEVIDHVGRSIKALFVKGSGSDMSRIDESGFTAMRQDELLLARSIQKMGDEEMISFLRKCMMDPTQNTPSVETFLHAFIPFKYVDHSHADYILSLTNTELSDEEISRVFNGKVLIFPYFQSGFELAKRFNDMIVKEDLQNYDGVILRNHGLFTWGSTAEESYRKHVKLISEAESFINTKWKGIPEGELPADAEEKMFKSLPELRRALSRKERKILTWERSPEAVGYSLSELASSNSTLGPATPDMLIRTKMDYLYLESLENAGSEIEKFAAKYEKEFREYVSSDLQMRDPYPCIVVIKGYGYVTAGNSKKDSLIIADMARHTFKVNHIASSISKNRFITRKEAFELEYWPPEAAKLSRRKELPLTGYIGLVTGAASGIGKATFIRFIEEGVGAIGGDVSEGVVGLVEQFKGMGMGLVFDISDESSVKNAIMKIVLDFGGIDIVFNNAGYLHPANLDEIEIEDLVKHVNINSIGTFIVTREAFRIMKRQGMGGCFVFNVTKNVTNPGPGMTSYGTSKAFVAQLSRYVSIEGGKYGIRSNVVNPDKIFRDSAIWQGGVLESRAKSKGISVEEYKKGNLLHVEVLPEHVANIVVELVKDEVFGATTGTMIPVDGGIQ